MVYLLERIANQTQSYTITSTTMSSIAQAPPPPPFVAPDWAVRVNGLWFASLIVSLATASLSILVKQWLREYLAVEWTSPQERLRARQYRKPALDKWKVFEIAAVLPMLLQVSVGLFFIGLCFFTASVDWRMARISMSLVSGWAFFLIVTTLLPLCSPRCPYKMPLLKSVMRTARRRVTMPLRCVLTLLAADSTAYWRQRVATPVRCLFMVMAAQLVTYLCSFQALVAKLAAYLTRRQYVSQDPYGEMISVLERGGRKDAGHRHDSDGQSSNRQYEEEDEFVGGSQDDADVLVLTDSIMANDSLLPMIWDAFKQRSQGPTQSLSFVFRLIANRIGAQREDLLSPRIQHIPDLSPLSRRAWDAFMEMLTELIRCQPGSALVSSHEWHRNFTLFLLSSLTYSLPKSAQLSLDSIMVNDGLLPMLRDCLRQSHDPAESFPFILRLITTRLGSQGDDLLLGLRKRHIPDLSPLSREAWDAVMGMLSELVHHLPDHVLLPCPEWLQNTTLLLLSRSLHPLPKPAQLSLGSIVSGDSLIPTTWDAFKQHSPDPPQSLSFILHLITRFLGDQGDELLSLRIQCIPDLSLLSQRRWDAFMVMLAELIHRQPGPLLVSSPEWLHNTTLLLLSSSPYPLPKFAQLSLDSIAFEDSLLPMIWDAFKQRSPHPTQSLSFVLRLINHHLGDQEANLLSPTIQRIPNLGLLSRRAWDTFMDMLAELIRHQPRPLPLPSPEWFQNIVFLLLSSSSYPLPKSAQLSLDSIMVNDGLLPTLQDSFRQLSHDPTESLYFILRLITTRLGSQGDDLLPGLRKRRIPDLSPLSREAWDAVMGMLAELVHHLPGPVLLPCPEWLQNTTLLLLSSSPYPLPESAKPSIDAIVSDGSLLPMIWDAFKQRYPTPTQCLSFVIHFITHCIGDQGDELLSPRIRCIPDLSPLPRQAWDAFTEMLAELTHRQPGPLLISSPGWLHNLTLLLLSVSPYPLPESAQSSLGALIDEPPETPGWERAHSIKTWIIRRSGEPEFMFRPVAQRLFPLFEASTSAQYPSLLTVFQMYNELLRPFCTSSPHSDSLYITLSCEKQLFRDSRARPILEDMWVILCANMMSESQNTIKYRVGTPEGLAILLDFGPGVGREANAAKAFEAFWANRLTTHTALCNGFSALHQRERCSGTHVLELIIKAFLKSEGTPSRRYDSAFPLISPMQIWPL